MQFPQHAEQAVEHQWRCQNDGQCARQAQKERVGHGAANPGGHIIDNIFDTRALVVKILLAGTYTFLEELFLGVLKG